MAMELLTSPTPNGWKVTIMLEELREAGFELSDVKVTPIDIMKGDQFTEAFTAVNPNQKIPALVDGNRNVIESCAILQYLGEKFPSPLLPDGEARWDVLPWVYWQAANVGPIFGNKLAYTRYITDVPDEARAHPLERFGKAITNTAMLGAFIKATSWVSLDPVRSKVEEYWGEENAALVTEAHDLTEVVERY